MYMFLVNRKVLTIVIIVVIPADHGGYNHLSSLSQDSASQCSDRTAPQVEATGMSLRLYVYFLK